MMAWWRKLRACLSDWGMRGAYKRYCEHHRAHHPDAEPLTYEAFYLQEQQRRWSGGPRRCC